MKDHEHQDTYFKCEQCQKPLEPYQVSLGLCSECRADSNNQLLDDCDAGLE